MTSHSEGSMQWTKARRIKICEMAMCLLKSTFSSNLAVISLIHFFFSFLCFLIERYWLTLLWYKCCCFFFCCNVTMNAIQKYSIQHMLLTPVDVTWYQVIILSKCVYILYNILCIILFFFYHPSVSPDNYLCTRANLKAIICMNMLHPTLCPLYGCVMNSVKHVFLFLFFFFCIRLQDIISTAPNLWSSTKI